MNKTANSRHTAWISLVWIFFVTCSAAWAQDGQANAADSLLARFQFDGTTDNQADASVAGQPGAEGTFVRGLQDRALRVGASDLPAMQIPSGPLQLNPNSSFTVQFWVRTVAPSDQRFVLVSQRAYPDNSLESQKRSGWTFYCSSGTWAWSIGSKGRRRLTYERDNGMRMPLNDGRWHQLTMSYEQETSTVRLFHDGLNKATYNVQDSTGFDFETTAPLTVGWKAVAQKSEESVLPAIAAGAVQLQQLVDAFQDTGIQEQLREDDLLPLVVAPARLFQRKLQDLERSQDQPSDESEALVTRLRAVDLREIEGLARRLTSNPYTIHQAVDFMKVAPLLKIYRLVDGTIEIKRAAAAGYAERERLQRAEWDIDQLSVWNRSLSPEEVRQSYARYFRPNPAPRPRDRSTLTIACWNIHHGGIHETVEEDGWDSRKTIAEIIRREGIDVVLMQETYSNGDFIAAELGFHFASTVDWDYLNQGANISVLSRDPIDSVDVPESAPFMNVAAKIAISEDQSIYAMSNWYGMQDFPKVAGHHREKFQDADEVAIFFGGDFNAVPHLDGGKSPASVHLIDAGFTDAYRELHPDVEKHPGHTHRSGSRIDQLYYKGNGYQNLSTEVLSTWPSIFPSDHYLIKSVFQLP